MIWITWQCCRRSFRNSGRAALQDLTSHFVAAAIARTAFLLQWDRAIDFFSASCEEMFASQSAPGGQFSTKIFRSRGSPTEMPTLDPGAAALGRAVAARRID